MSQIKITETIDDQVVVRTYDMTTAGSAKISLKDILVFQREAAVVGIDVTWDDVENLGTRDPETLTSVDKALLMTVNLWLTLRSAGEAALTLNDVANIDLDTIEFINDEPEQVVEAVPFEPTPTPSVSASQEVVEAQLVPADWGE